MDENKTIIKELFLNSNVNFLLGAGSSHENITGVKCFPLMSDLAQHIKNNDMIKEYYDGLSGDSCLLLIKNIYDKYLFVEKANVELFLTALEGLLQYLNTDSIYNDLSEQVVLVKNLIFDRIIESDINSCIDNYKNFYSSLKLLMESNSLNNQVINVFTTNYDMMNEISLEKLNIHYYNGFDGVVNKKFNPTYYNYSYVDRFDYKKSSINITTNHINLYKLHGSLSWTINKNGDLIEKNPYESRFLPEIVYPSFQKFNSTNVIVSYSTLLRDFSNIICNSNTSLFVSGTSLGDEHINKIIENALGISTFHLVVFCFSNDEIKSMSKKFEFNKNVIIYKEPILFSGIPSLIEETCL